MAYLIHTGLKALFGTVSAITHTSKQKVVPWVKNVDWVTLEDAWDIAKEENKFICVVVYEDNDTNTEKLKDMFKRSKPLQEESKGFVMVKVSSNEANKMKSFHPDGTYIPRILFFDPNGKLMPKARPATDSFTVNRYYYTSQQQIHQTMKNILSDPDKFISKNY